MTPEIVREKSVYIQWREGRSLESVAGLRARYRDQEFTIYRVSFRDRWPVVHPMTDEVKQWLEHEHQVCHLVAGTWLCKASDYEPEPPLRYDADEVTLLDEWPE